MDHTARRQKQQGFEKRVGHQMENTGRKSTHAQPQEHVTELADGGVGQNFLDVSLHQTDGGGIESSQAADGRHCRQRKGRVGKEDVRAGDHVDAGRDHGGGVDERTDRRRAFHRVRQPDVERYLRRFSDRAHQQQESNGRQHARLAGGERLRGQHTGTAEDSIEIQTAEGPEEKEQRQQEAEIAQPVDDKSFLAGVAGRVAEEVETDEQVGAESDSFPSHKEQGVVAR